MSLEKTEMMMNRTVFVAAVALVLGSTLYLAAQQGPPPAGPPGGRRGGGPPGEDPKSG